MFEWLIDTCFNFGRKTAKYEITFFFFFINSQFDQCLHAYTIMAIATTKTKVARIMLLFTCTQDNFVVYRYTRQ